MYRGELSHRSHPGKLCVLGCGGGITFVSPFVIPLHGAYVTSIYLSLRKSDQEFFVRIIMDYYIKTLTYLFEGLAELLREKGASHERK